MQIAESCTYWVRALSHPNMERVTPIHYRARRTAKHAQSPQHCHLVTPTYGFFRLSVGTRGGRALATAKNRTDARWTVKKTRIGVTQTRATDSRRTKRKLSFDQNFAPTFDPPGHDPDAPSRQNGHKTRWTVEARRRRAIYCSDLDNSFHSNP